MTIYIDMLFIENLIMNLAIILSESIVLNLHEKYFRKFVAGGIGALFYILTFVFTKLYLIQVLVCLIIVKVAFNPPNLKALLKEALLFYFISFVYGGISFALTNFLNFGKICIINGILFTNFSAFIIPISIFVGIFFILIVLRNKKKHIFKDIVIGTDVGEAQLRVLLDTGNLLKEPYTGKPVIIVEKDSLKTVLSGDIIANFNDILSRKKKFTFRNVFNSI